MKWFGLKTCFLLFVIILAAGPFGGNSLLYNDMGLAINLFGLAVFIAGLFFIPKSFYTTSSFIFSLVFIVCTIRVIGFIFSALKNIVELTSSKPHLPKDDGSAVIIVPLAFIFTIGWGILFDVRKRHIAQTSA